MFRRHKSTPGLWKAFRQSWIRVVLPPIKFNSLAALYTSQLPCAQPSCTKAQKHTAHTINLEATAAADGAGRAAASSAPLRQSAGVTRTASTAASPGRRLKSALTISTAQAPTPADRVCDSTMPGGSLCSSVFTSSGSADIDAPPLASSPPAAAPQAADEKALVLVGPPQTGVAIRSSSQALSAAELPSTDELEQTAVEAMRAYCQAWGPGELGDEFFDWLDWARSAGVAVFLDVVLEAHRLGDGRLQRFFDYFGQGPAAELLSSVMEVLLHSGIARNADLAVTLGEAHLDALGEDTCTRLMQGYLLLGGPNPEARVSASLPPVAQAQGSQLITSEPISARLNDEDFCGMLLDSGLLDDSCAVHHSSSSCSLSMLSPSGSLAVPAGHRRLTASSQDAAPMRLGVMAAGAEAGDVDVPPELRCSAAQHDLAPSPAPPSRASDAAGVLQPPAQGSALVPAAAAPSTAPSAPAVSPARAQQAAERPVVPRLDFSKLATPHSPEPSYIPAQARTGRRIKKLLRKVAAAICCKKPRVVA